MDKSYVTLEVCPICQKETGTIIMDRRLRDSFDMHTVNPGNTCDDCKTKYLAKGVMLINPKTGGLVVIKDKAFQKVFNKPLPPKKIAFVDEQILTRLQSA